MSANVTELYPKSSPEDFRVTTAFQSARQRLSFLLYDRDGKPLNLVDTDMLEAGNEEAVPNQEPEFSDGQVPKRADDLVVRIIYRLGVQRSDVPYAVVGKIEDAECGKVSFIFEGRDLAYAGIYQAQIQVGKHKLEKYVPGRADDIELFHTYPIFISVEPNVESPLHNSKTITIPEVRMHLFDNDPAKNLTLAENEFSDAEILSAATHAIDIWNDTLPPVAYRDSSNFPYKAKWLDGTVAILLSRIAKRKMRNTLAYRAGGVQTDDQNFQLYQQMADIMMQEYKHWVAETKMSINMQMGFSSLGGIGH